MINKMIQIRPVCVRTRTGRKKNGLIRLRGSGNTARGKISAPGADIIPKWSCIRTLSADMNKLSEITKVCM